MPVAVVQEWLEDETDRSTTNYDAIHERLMQSPGRGASRAMGSST
jgi:hypothetical protein